MNRGATETASAANGLWSNMAAPICRLDYQRTAERDSLQTDRGRDWPLPRKGRRVGRGLLDHAHLLNDDWRRRRRAGRERSLSAERNGRDPVHHIHPVADPAEDGVTRGVVRRARFRIEIG